MMRHRINYRSNLVFINSHEVRLFSILFCHNQICSGAAEYADCAAHVQRDSLTAYWDSRRDFVFRYQSPKHFVDIFRAWNGPVHKAFVALDADTQEALKAAIIKLIHEFNAATDGTMAVPCAAFVDAVRGPCRPIFSKLSCLRRQAQRGASGVKGLILSCKRLSGDRPVERLATASQDLLMIGAGLNDVFCQFLPYTDLLLSVPIAIIEVLSETEIKVVNRRQTSS